MPQLDFISLFPIILGVLLLFLGRKIFWLFAGAVAFIAALTFIPKYATIQQPTLFYICLAVGVIAATAGVFLQKIVLRGAGFIAGGYVFFGLWEKLMPNQALPWYLPFLIGGVLGALLLSFLFDWAMIILSSLTGAFLIVQALKLEQNMQLIVLVALAVVGIVAQIKMKLGKSKEGE
jgi:hypothetical protein